MAQSIQIYGVIGWDVMAERVVDQLEAIAQSDDQDVRVHLNSGGGLVDEALAIHNRLVSHPGRVSVIIDALAASAATLIMLAADDVTMPDNASLMIHMPWNTVSGNADELREVADELDEIGSRMVQMYAQATGIDADEMRAMLLTETWLSAEQAKELGFVDFVTSPVRSVNVQKETAAAAYLGRAAASNQKLPTYQHPPSWVPTIARQSQATEPRRASDLIDTTRGNTQEVAVMATKTNNSPAAQEQADDLAELKARIEELDAENEELRTALEANREEVDEVSSEKEVVEKAAAALERRVEELEDEAVRRDIRAAGVPVEHHNELVALRRANTGLFDATVKALARKGPSVQPTIGSQGAATSGTGYKQAKAILAEAEDRGVSTGNGSLSLWVRAHYPDQFEEVMKAAGC